jgi:prepilin-type N-terminal cleavage/methylation domain-containing protein
MLLPLQRLNSSKRGFSLIEILIALLVISILLVAALGMTTRFVSEAAWDRLFVRLERQFLDTNTYALAGFSKAFALTGEKIEEVPEMIHLYYELGGEMGAWYLETKKNEDPALLNDRLIAYQEFLPIDDVEPIVLKSLALIESDDPDSTSLLTRPAVIITWQNPFSLMNFHFFDVKLAKVGEKLADRFTLPDVPEQCQGPIGANCFLSLTYERPGTTQVKSMVFSKQKGVYKDF